MPEAQYTEIIEALIARIAELERNVAELNVHQHQFNPHPSKPVEYRNRTTRPIGFGSKR